MTPAIIIALVAGIAIGVFLTIILSPKAKNDSGNFEEQLNDLKNEHDQYQQQVSLHFQQSANMIHEMNERQQQISLHLSQGLDDLVAEEHRIAPSDENIDDQETTELLEQDDHEAVQAPVDYQK